MPISPQHLQCPFCSQVSSRGTGLSSHIRTRHPKQYRKWNQNPNRLVEASRGKRSAQEEVEEPRETVTAAAAGAETSQAPEETTAAAPAMESPEVVAHRDEVAGLLQKAYDQMISRKQTIESELARIDALKSEHEAISTQLDALNQAMSAFRRA